MASGMTSIYDTVYMQLKEEQEHRHSISTKFKLLLVGFVIGMAAGISLLSVSDSFVGLKYSLIFIFGFIVISVVMLSKYAIDIYTSLTLEHTYMNRIATIKNSYLESINSSKRVFEFEIDDNKSNKENQEDKDKKFNASVTKKTK